MPVDMAVQLYITHSPPLHSFLSSYQDYRTRNLNHCKPVRSCINSKNTHNSHNAGPNTPRHAWQLPEPKAKKKVVFADSKGMSLTAVRIFSPCENKIPESPLQSHSLKLGGSLNTTQSRILEFRQPASDYLDFRNRLMKNSVCLESCTLQGHTLTGTVKVRNLSYEKSVCVRITFDSWKSYREVACTFMNDVCGCRDTDTFFFMVEIPARVPPQDSVEFCVSFTSDGKTHWDNNNGKNYSLVAKHDENKENADKTDLFDQFRRQRKCDRISNEWKSWTTAIGAPTGDTLTQQTLFFQI